MANEKQEPTAEELDKQEQDDFDAGAATVTGDKPVAAVVKAEEKSVPEPKDVVTKPDDVKPPAKPQYVQITKEQLESLTAAATKTASFDSQFSKVFGTLGDVQKIVKTLQAGTPKGAKVEVPKDAFAELEKDFPEMAERIRAGLEKTLQNTTGTGGTNAEVDETKFETLVSKGVVKLEMEALDDEHPDWRKIVGAIDQSKNEKPDPKNAFRKWLGTKDAAYQAKINGTNSARIISRAITLFQKEAVTPPPPKKPDEKPADARRARVAGAVQPRGDGAPPAQRKDEDEFEAGFQSG